MNTRNDQKIPDNLSDEFLNNFTLPASYCQNTNARTRGDDIHRRVNPHLGTLGSNRGFSQDDFKLADFIKAVNHTTGADIYTTAAIYQNPNNTPTSTSPNYPNLLFTDSQNNHIITDLTNFVTYLGTQLGSSFTIANTLFVATNGDNTSATVGKLDKPWKDPAAAIAAANSGQAVVIFPGTYTYADPGDGLLINQKTKAFAFPGVLIRYTNVSPLSISPFKTTNTITGGTFKGYADIVYTKTGGQCEIGGYIDGSLDIEVQSFTITQSSAVFTNGALTLFKARNFSQIGNSQADYFLFVNSTTDVAPTTAKRLRVDIDYAFFNNCDKAIFLQSNKALSGHIHIKTLYFNNLVQHLIESENPECTTSILTVDVDNLVQVSTTTNVQYLLAMISFGNSSGDSDCQQQYTIRNANVTLAPLSCGDCLSGITKIDITGTCKLSTGMESGIFNTGAGKCLINLDVLLIWPTGTPIPDSEFTGIGSLPNTHVSGNIVVIGKTSGDGSIWRVDGSSENYCRFKNLEMVTGADYCVGGTAVGITALPNTNTFSNKPIDPTSNVDEKISTILDDVYVQ